MRETLPLNWGWIQSPRGEYIEQKYKDEIIERDASSESTYASRSRRVTGRSQEPLSWGFGWSGLFTRTRINEGHI